MTDFDAFVSFCPDDHPFVELMTDKLEKEGGLKLCIIGRDIHMVQFEQEVIIDVISKRCHKTILVISPFYLQNTDCERLARTVLALYAGYPSQAPPQPVYPQGAPPAYSQYPQAPPAYGAPPQAAYYNPPQVQQGPYGAQPQYLPPTHAYAAPYGVTGVQQNMGGMSQSVQVRPQGTVVVQGGFDAGARFDGVAQPNVPPPPPGYLPNAAQAATMQGQNVVVTQQRSNFWEGGSGGGYTMF